MPFDGEEHGRAEHEHLEGDEDYGDPIDHFESFQPMTWHCPWWGASLPDMGGESVSDGHASTVLPHLVAHTTQKQFPYMSPYVAA
jgi:hypothetical protein